MERRHLVSAALVLAAWGCNAGPNNGPAKPSSGTTSAPSTSTSSGSTSTPASTSSSSTSTSSGSSGSTVTFRPSSPPSSALWRTEDEEVAWINATGFNVTVADLRASYASFTPQPVPTTINILWDTETDDLRNYYRLAKRTGNAAFLQQAQYWHDFQVNTYSNWQNGGTNVVEPEHVYMMGLVDWYVDHQDQATLDAINRIIDFVKTVSGNPFYETRVSARCLQCLAYYMEKIGIRAAEVNAKIQEFVTGINGAKVVNGFVTMHLAVGTGWTVDNMPASIDLTQKFPGDAAASIVTSPTTYDVKGFDAVGTYQDCMLMHALNVASRVTGDPSLAVKSADVANAWLGHVAPAFWDTTGQYALTVPYYLIPGAKETDLFHYPGKSTPIYVSQYAAFCPDAATQKKLIQQTLLRAYSEISAVQPSELGGKPKYWPWQTWEQGYFLLQK